jgi:hypothetical protein
LRSDFAVDHVIPFALWGNNDLWNLVPADPKTNGNKSDKLPATELLHSRRAEILMNWDCLRAELPEPFDRQAQHLLGKPLAAHSAWKSELFSVMREAIEMTAIQRGVERWHPAGVAVLAEHGIG